MSCQVCNEDLKDKGEICALCNAVYCLTHIKDHNSSFTCKICGRETCIDRKGEKEDICLNCNNVQACVELGNILKSSLGEEVPVTTPTKKKIVKTASSTPVTTPVTTSEEKTPEKKTPEKKVSEEKTPEKKVFEEKTPEKKTPEKKTPEKKTPEKKVTPKKTVAKKKE